MSIGTMVKEWREFRGLTQGELAEKAGVSKSTIHYVETEEHGQRLATLTKIADALDCELMLLFERRDEPAATE